MTNILTIGRALPIVYGYRLVQGAILVSFTLGLITNPATLFLFTGLGALLCAAGVPAVARCVRGLGELLWFAIPMVIIAMWAGHAVYSFVTYVT